MARGHRDGGKNDSSTHKTPSDRVRTLASSPNPDCALSADRLLPREQSRARSRLRALDELLACLRRHIGFVACSRFFALAIDCLLACGGKFAWLAVPDGTFSTFAGTFA